jgi:membrane protease YdiL (CAAX protease family)
VRLRSSHHADAEAPEASAEAAPIAPTTPLPAPLRTLDSALAAVGIAALLVMAVRRLRRPRPVYPPRENRFAQETVLSVMIAYFGGFIAAGILFRGPGAEDPSILATLAAALFAQIAATVVALVLARRDFAGGAPRFLLGRELAPVLRLTPVALLIALGVCPLVLEVTVRLIQFLAPHHVFEPHSTIRALRDETRSGLIVAGLWFSAAAAAPVAEEIFFRGLIQTVLFNLTARRRLAVIFASLAFGAVHFPNPETIPALVAFGLLLGWLYERTGSLAAPILVHALFNLKTLIAEAVAGA